MVTTHCWSSVWHFSDTMDEVEAATASIAQPKSEEDTDSILNSVTLEHSAEQILNGIKRSVEVQYLVPMMMTNDSEASQQNQQTTQQAELQCPFKESGEDFLNRFDVSFRKLREIWFGINVIRRFPEPGIQGGRCRGMRTRERGISCDGSESKQPRIKRGRSRDHRIGESFRRRAQLPILRINVAVAAAIRLTYGRQQTTFYCDRWTSDTECAVARWSAGSRCRWKGRLRPEKLAGKICR